jgi:TolB-like protein/tetratricopeptide (TPR) repeat protein
MKTKPRAYQRLFAELKRRRVFNTAALYGGVAFIVFQAADFVVPALRLSESVSTVIVLIAVFGFPIAMMLAWFFDLTSGGMKRTDPPEKGELETIVAQSWLRRWTVGIGAVLGVVLLLGGVGWDLKSRESTGNPASPDEELTIGSVAVLPFLNLIGDEEEVYLSEGIANELLEALRRVPGLRVTGRTSAFSFKNTGVDLASVGKELNVASLLEGSVGDAGDQVELAVRLVASGDGDHGWTRSYQLPKEGFLIALDDVAWAIAGQLGAEVPDERQDPLVPPSRVDFTAYRDYLRGRYLSQQGTPDALESAIAYYNKTLLLGPDFAPAWSALATAYVLLPEHGGPPMKEILPYVQAVLDQAMRPGREMAEGYAASGYLKWVYLWDLPGAEDDFRKALELDPESPVPRYWYAQFLTTLRRWEEGLDQVSRALELDPRSAAAHLTRGLLLLCAGLDGASASLRRALELSPEMHPAAYVLAGHLAFEGDFQGAAEEFDRFSSMTGSDPSPFRSYLAALADPSERPEAVAAFQESAFYGPAQGAELLAHLGETDAALALLERLARARSPDLPWVNAMPQFQRIRSDPRFQGVLAWVGL